MLRPMLTRVLQALPARSCAPALFHGPSILPTLSTVPSFTASFATEATKTTEQPNYVITEVIEDEVETESLRKAWYKKKRISGSVKKLNLLARQVGNALTSTMADVVITLIFADPRPLRE